jgi:hypothetical protein
MCNIPDYQNASNAITMLHFSDAAHWCNLGKQCELEDMGYNEFCLPLDFEITSDLFSLKTIG